MGDEPAARAGVDSGTPFESVLRASGRAMLQFADFVLEDLSAAEDATQDALVIAWRRRKIAKVEGDHGGWLRRIVLRECLRWRRHPLFRVFALKDRVVGLALSTDRKILFLNEGYPASQLRSRLRSGWSSRT